MRIIKYLVICFLLVFLSGCAKEIEPIGEAPAALPEEPAPTIINVDLTSDKVMTPDSLDVNKGDFIRFYNRDERFYHNLIIYSGDVDRPTQKDVIVQSGNIDPGDYWEYVFEESGEYVIKDIYSGTMRGMITAETTGMPIEDALEKGMVIGRVSVS